MTDYKEYALSQVENFLYDAMSADATAQEIYDVIRGVVQDNYYTYKHHTSKAYDLLSLLNGHRLVDLDDTVQPKDKVIKWSLPVEEHEDGEYYITLPEDLLEAADLKEGDQIEWIPQDEDSYILQKVEVN
jgi:hypothetical protein